MPHLAYEIIVPEAGPDALALMTELAVALLSARIPEGAAMQPLEPLSAKNTQATSEVRASGVRVVTTRRNAQISVKADVLFEVQS